MKTDKCREDGQVKSHMEEGRKERFTRGSQKVHMKRRENEKR